MFLMFVVVASSVFYGRVYCGYLCPQMIFSEASVALETWLRKRVTKSFPRWKPLVRERAAAACSTRCWPSPVSSWPSSSFPTS